VDYRLLDGPQHGDHEAGQKKAAPVRLQELEGFADSCEDWQFFRHRPFPQTEYQRTLGLF
jgi:hypothetical protein